MVTELPSKFNFSDEIVFKIFPIFSLIIFGSMIFFSISYRPKKIANNDNKIDEIIKVEELEKVELRNNKDSKKIHPLEKKNRRIFGDEHVDNLKAKYVELKLRRINFRN